nr:hypothetical protein [Candidatus Sigynarchaeota archaeon]
MNTPPKSWPQWKQTWCWTCPFKTFGWTAICNLQWDEEKRQAGKSYTVAIASARKDRCPRIAGEPSALSLHFNDDGCFDKLIEVQL